MIDEKKLNEVKSRIKNHLSDRIIEAGHKPDFIDFFLGLSKSYLDSAKLEFKVSNDHELSKQLGFINFNSPVVIINSSYYAMFNMARALLENEGIKIKTKLGIHTVTFDALVHFFYFTRKLEKWLIESFAEAIEESAELTGREKAKELVSDLMHERIKRGAFNYEMSDERIESKAKTSLNRAIHFCDSIKRIINNG